MRIVDIRKSMREKKTAKRETGNKTAKGETKSNFHFAKVIKKFRE